MNGHSPKLQVKMRAQGPSQEGHRLNPIGFCHGATHLPFVIAVIPAKAGIYETAGDSGVRRNDGINNP
jgi:hypothetical protein